MKITANQLDDAVTAGILGQDQAQRLKEFVAARKEPGLGHGLVTTMLHYVGGGVALVAMGAFLSLAEDRHGAAGLVGVGTSYLVAGLMLAEACQRAGKHLIAEVLSFIAVLAVPWTLYGLMSHTYTWHDTALDKFALAAATVGAAALALWRYRAGTQLLLLALAGWASAYFGTVFVIRILELWVDTSGGEFAQTVALPVGLLLLAAATHLDLALARTANRTIWLHIVGTVAVMYSTDIQSHVDLLVYLGLIAYGTACARRLEVFVGAFGLLCHLGYLAYEVFSGSWLFPGALTLLGLATAYSGMLWTRQEARIVSWSRGCLPPGLRRRLDERRPT